MSKPWTWDYYYSLVQRLTSISDGLIDRLAQVVKGIAAPDIDAIPIGSARDVRASVVVFDIRRFSELTGAETPEALQRALAVLDLVIPTVMQVIHDHGGYVEKNTGDGVMGVIGIGMDEVDRAQSALDAAATIAYFIWNNVNPHLLSLGLPQIQFRIGIDTGRILLGRIGLPTGSAKHQRNFLTAVGPTANIATRLQQAAGTDEIWVGDQLRQHAPFHYALRFENVTPADWTWTYTANGNVYPVWKYTDKRTMPMPEFLKAFLKSPN